jgi:hypothetical protein
MIKTYNDLIIIRDKLKQDLIEEQKKYGRNLCESICRDLTKEQRQIVEGIYPIAVALEAIGYKYKDKTKRTNLCKEYNKCHCPCNGKIIIVSH